MCLLLLFFTFLFLMSFLYLFFFFSSRRRHTRCLSDWSSDVCSSDLPDALVEIVLQLHLADDRVERAGVDLLDDCLAIDLADALDRLLQHLQARIGRSEERRVGKECRYRWGRDP